MNWDVKNVPRQDGRLAVITGASGGLGFEVAKVLVAKGAEVTIAARNADKGSSAARSLGSRAQFELLDLADLRSVRSFADRLLKQGRSVSLLINNAGLAAPPSRLLTRDGFEPQFGTNFLGHFALTLQLLPLLEKRFHPRVITVSSLVEKSAKIDLNDLMSERKYSPTRSYGQSKLANLLFARELQRRSDAHGWGLLSVAAHPGIAVTELTKSRPGQPVLKFNKFFELISPLIGQTAAQGALPVLYAATFPGVEPGGYYGPQGFMDLKGAPGKARSSKISQDPEIAASLWAEAERLTGVTFEDGFGIVHAQND